MDEVRHETAETHDLLACEKCGKASVFTVGTRSHVLVGTTVDGEPVYHRMSQIAYVADCLTPGCGWSNARPARPDRWA